ncbi:MAG TPA: PadR family transcriptional regulator [Caulobacteraceae bacterium]|jgi:DNA-binding PadR family transcriptional regulator|nr:PadR family transcriptional regulator [Caulobacteraceae bacterium]
MHFFQSHRGLRRFAHWRGERHAHPHGRHGSFMGGDQRGHRRGGRVFDQGDLRWVMLQLIADKPSHGYELIKAIEERLGGGYAPSPGVIYPTLTLLEDLGWIAAAQSEGARKAYAITQEGRAALENNAEALDRILARMDEVAERSRGGRSPQIARAMQNLGVALGMRLQQERSDAELTRIVKIIDEAARTIESGGA